MLTPLNRAGPQAVNLQHPQFWGGASGAPCPSAPLEWIWHNPILPSQHCSLPHFAFQCGPAPLPSHSHPHPGLRFSCC